MRMFYHFGFECFHVLSQTIVQGTVMFKTTIWAYLGIKLVQFVSVSTLSVKQLKRGLPPCGLLSRGTVPSHWWSWPSSIWEEERGLLKKQRDEYKLGDLGSNFSPPMAGPGTLSHSLSRLSLQAQQSGMACQTPLITHREPQKQDKSEQLVGIRAVLALCTFCPSLAESHHGLPHVASPLSFSSKQGRSDD